MHLVLLVSLALAISQEPEVPDELALPALAHAIEVSAADRVACVDVRDRASPSLFLSRINAPGHKIVSLADCSWSPKGMIGPAHEHAIKIELSNLTRKSEFSVEVTVAWYQSSADAGHETLILTRENDAWRVTGSLGKWIT